MPQTLALGLFYLGAPMTLVNGLVGVGALGSILPAAFNIGVGLGIAEAASLLMRPDAPKPDDVQTSLHIQTTFRTRHYGWMKTSGNWLFCDSYHGSLYKVINFGQGKMVEIAEYWVDDDQVTLDANFFAVESPYTNRIRIETRQGLPTETYYSALAEVFPDWTPAHRGDGIATGYIFQKALKADKVFQVFPNGKDTLIRVVAKFTEVLNVTTGVAEWSDNAALIIRDFMGHADGARMPAARLSTPQAMDAWREAQARADLPRALKLGGTEPWYRLWGSYTFNERPGDVLSRMLAACNARTIVTRDGGIAIDIRKYAESEIAPLVLDNDVITGFQDLGKGLDFVSTANVIKGTYLAVDHDWQEAEADPWVDEDDVERRGEISTDRQFLMAPSHGQARYLMKLESYRANPEWVATFYCRKVAAELFQWPLARVDYWIGPVHVEGVFEITKFDFVVSNQGILTGFAISVASMPLVAGTWNAATEEGDAPVADESDGDHDVPLPTGFGVTIRRKTVSGVVVPFALLEFDAPSSDSLSIQARGRNVDDEQWIPIPVDDGATQAESFVLADGETYVFQIRYVTTALRDGNWVTSDEILAVADTVAPVALASFAVNGSAPHLGNAGFILTTANDAHLKSVRLFRVAHGAAFNPAALSPISTFAVGALSTFGAVDGDATTANVITGGDFSNSSDWPTQVGGASVTGGKAVHAAGALGSVRQPFSPVASAKYRYGFSVTGSTAGSVQAGFLTGTTVLGPTHSGNGQMLGDVTSASGNDTVLLAFTATSDASADNFAMFRETAASAPQGSWDYYAVPYNGSGIAGPSAGPLNVVVI